MKIFENVQRDRRQVHGPRDDIEQDKGCIEDEMRDGKKLRS